MPTTVSTARVSDVVIASRIVGSSTSARHDAPVRSPVPGTFVLKSSRASSGTRKKAVKASSSSQRNTRQSAGPRAGPGPVTTAIATSA
jgi:hypothetical protein